MLKRVPDYAASPPPSLENGRRPSPPWLAEIEERLRDRKGFYESLTPEQFALLRSYDGPEVIGPPPPPPMPRRPRRRGET